MFRVIMRERRRREVDLTIALLRNCLAEAEKPRAADAYTRERLTGLLEFFELARAPLICSRNFRPNLLKIARMGEKAVRLLGFAT